MMRQRPGGGGAGYAGAAGAAGGSQNYYGGYAGGGGAGGGGYSGGSSNGYGGYSGGGGGGYQNYGGYNAGSAGYGPATGYAATPMATSTTSTDDKYSKPSSKSTASLGSLMSGGGGPNPMVLLCILMGLWGIATVGLWMNVRTKYNSVLKEFNVPNANALLDLYKSLQEDLADMQRQKDQSIRDKTRKEYGRQQELERENRLLQKERDELRVKYEGPDKEEEESRLQLREDAFQKQVALLQEATRKESKRSVLERFGPGPHEVQFSFNMNGNDKSFVVEMAPLDDVPHAVHVFMEQVEHGLWNGCYFYLNGPHVIQAGPQLSEDDEADLSSPDDSEEGEVAMKPFQSQGLDQLAFPDYSENFPHLPWTLGFTGRPGGPDFYINKVDNVKSHGPGGQYQHVLHEQGDSCFGKITRGKEQAAALFAQPVYGDRSEWHYFLTEPVKITKAEILTKRAAVDSSSSSTTKTKDEVVPEQEPPHDPIQALNEKRKRKPRRPKITHAVDP